MTKSSKNGHMPLIAASTRFSLVKGERIVRSVLTARLRDFQVKLKLLNILTSQIIAWSRSHPSSPNKVVAATNSTVKLLVFKNNIIRLVTSQSAPSNMYLTQNIFKELANPPLYTNPYQNRILPIQNLNLGIEISCYAAVQYCTYMDVDHVPRGGLFLSIHFYTIYGSHENTTVLHNLLVQGKQLVRFEEA
ncbi:unnamed protein product [Prunus brigantina]